MAREKDDTEWAKDLRAEKMAGKGHIGVMGDDTWRRVERLTTHATTWIFGSRCRTKGGRFVVMHLILIVRGLKDGKDTEYFRVRAQKMLLQLHCPSRLKNANPFPE